MSLTSQKTRNFCFTIIIKDNKTYDLGFGEKLSGGKIARGVASQELGVGGPDSDEHGENRNGGDGGTPIDDRSRQREMGGDVPSEQGEIKESEHGGLNEYDVLGWGGLVDSTGRHDPLGLTGNNPSIIQWIYQLEHCPTTSKLHFQGYIRFRSPLRISGVKKHLKCNWAHVESTRGSHESNLRYCSKRDSQLRGPWAGGNNMEQGKRTDINTLAADISERGLTAANVRQSNPDLYCRYRGGIRDIVADAAKKRALQFRNVECLVYHGTAGVGKTRTAVEQGGDSFYFLDHSGEGRLWFDGYEGETTLIIDDFYGWIKWHMFLRILDGHPLRLEIKGGFTFALWTKIIITSNKPPDLWYERGMPPELQRRITTITHLE